MKNLLIKTIVNTISILNEKKILKIVSTPNVEIEETKNISHGDFSTNVAMQLAKEQRMNPNKIAEYIVSEINDTYNIIGKTEIANPGFINFFINPSAWHNILCQIHEKNQTFGFPNIGNGKKIQIEFVSSNPTGPLHIGHGRGAAIGDSMANVFSACGFNVEKEYYINDAGNQISTLGLSIYLRAKSLLKIPTIFPDHCYQGDYIKQIAKKLIKKEKHSLFLEEDEKKAINICAKYASEIIITQIRNDLEDFNIKFDCWFSEQSLYVDGKIKEAINFYKKQGLIYEKNGAQWFSTSNFGDEKDRVVIRKNGKETYFASDIAYHKDKFDRGFQEVINVWGSDHHGYVPRLKAVIKASKKDKNQFKVILVNLVTLLRNKEPISMSTRTGNFITLKEVIKEVGKDAARFLFLTRHHDSPLEFDIELAKKKSKDNPVYYVQYAYARITKIINKWEKLNSDKHVTTNFYLNLLVDQKEIELIKKMSIFPEVIKLTCQFMEPHRIAFYLIDLASILHTYYNKERILNNNDLKITKARIHLIMAVKKVIRNGLNLLGVNAPRKM